MTQIWFITAAVLLLAELLVPTFFILPFAVGSFFAGIVSLFTESQNIKFINKLNYLVLFTVRQISKISQFFMTNLILSLKN